MFRQSAIAFTLLACCLIGCSGEKGAKITGVILENGQPLRVGEKDAVLLSMVPVQVDEKASKASPGAEFKRDDSTFIFVGPHLGLVPPSDYKICLTVRPREGIDRYAGAFESANSPLVYTVTNEPKQELVIDVTKKTVTRK